MCVLCSTMYHYVICYLSTPGTSLSTLSSLPWKASQGTLKPNGILNHLYLPHGVFNVVSRLLLKSNGTCQSSDVASLMVKYLDCASSGKCHLEFLHTTGFSELLCSSLLGLGTVLDCHLLSLLVL